MMTGPVRHGRSTRDFPPDFQPGFQPDIGTDIAPARWGWLVFLLLAVAGLFYVKWWPYYHRALAAQASHSIGQSILMGTAARAPHPSLAAALDYAWAYGKAIWQALVLGLLLGSAVQALLPARWVARVLGRRGWRSVAAGGLLAVPGMMCTCCAAPVVVGLRARQASAGGALAFWLGNSVLNPATLVFMGFVLGWRWSALRLALGVVLVFGLGWLVDRMTARSTARPGQPAARLDHRLTTQPAAQPAAQSTARSVAPDEPARAVDAKRAQTAQIASSRAHSLFARWLRIFLRMSVRLVPEYLVLVLLLGAARAWLFPHVGPDVTSSLGWIVAFAVAGMLFVIPTAGEVPIIQAMLALGMGVGPAGALLMTLPPVSLPSLAMLARSFRWRVLAFVAGTVVLLGVAAGLAMKALGG